MALDNSTFTEPDTPLYQLRERLNARWQKIPAARDAAWKLRRELHSALADHDTDDTSIVVLARDELTQGSDIDWTLLVDGIADPKHLDVALAIQKYIETLHRQPGREGTFGNLAFSHPIIHEIGGEDDTNRNTTRRILLLLESKAIGRAEAHDRVVANVLRRYLEEDRGLWYGSGHHRVPRFLLNDILRYWHTMLVDFAYKQRSRGGKGWALRGLKLRMSRKLIFVSGLLACFRCGLDSPAPGKNLSTLIEHLRELLLATPLELVASTALKFPSILEPTAALFEAYDDFLGILNDRTKRDHLDGLTPYDKLDDDELFQEGREVSHRFQGALNAIFLTEGSPFYHLTLKYGFF